MSIEKISDNAPEKSWYLIAIESHDENQERLKGAADGNLIRPENVKAMDEDPMSKLLSYDWLFWSPIIPRVDDTLQFPGWQVHVTEVILSTDTDSTTGSFKGNKVSASIRIRENSLSAKLNLSFGSDITETPWSEFANRGNDVEYQLWDLEGVAKQDLRERQEKAIWAGRIKPSVGDLIEVNDSEYRITSVKLNNANSVREGKLLVERTV